VESWHRCLKEVYLQSSKTQRMDILVYILWDMVLPDVMMDHVKTTTGIQQRRMNRSETRRYDLAYAISGNVFIILFGLGYFIDTTLYTLYVLFFFYR
jgi:hypothetical protein